MWCQHVSCLRHTGNGVGWSSQGAYCVNLRLLLAATLCDVCKYSDTSCCCCCPAGDLEMSCPQSGLFLTLTFAKDHTVKGTIEQLKPAKPPAYAAAGAAAGGASVPAPAAAAGISTSSGRVGGGAGRGQVVGSLEGSWMGVINVVCPSLVSVSNRLVQTSLVC